MQRGEKVGNFVLRFKIESISQLCIELESMDSIFWRHKMYPTAFISHWSYIRLKKEVKYGNFWYATKNEKKCK